MKILLLHCYWRQKVLNIRKLLNNQTEIVSDYMRIDIKLQVPVVIYFPFLYNTISYRFYRVGHRHPTAETLV